MMYSCTYIGIHVHILATFKNVGFWPASQVLVSMKMVQDFQPWRPGNKCFRSSRDRAATHGVEHGQVAHTTYMHVARGIMWIATPSNLAETHLDGEVTSDFVFLSVTISHPGHCRQ